MRWLSNTRTILQKHSLEMCIKLSMLHRDHEHVSYLCIVYDTRTSPVATRIYGRGSHTPHTLSTCTISISSHAQHVSRRAPVSPTHRQHTETMCACTCESASRRHRVESVNITHTHIIITYTSQRNWRASLAAVCLTMHTLQNYRRWFKMQTKERKNLE